MTSPKYPRTYHLPWSPGASNDDKIMSSIDGLLHVPLILSEKLDGSNVCLERNNVFARSHSDTPSHPSFDALKALHACFRYLIDTDIQIFGEWCYAKHSIVYDTLPSYLLIFGVRQLNNSRSWCSWDQTCEIAKNLCIPTVPVLWSGKVSSEKELQTITSELMDKPSIYGETREGVVVRHADIFGDDKFATSIGKMVRKNHVQTSDHWKHQEIVKNKLTGETI